MKRNLKNLILFLNCLRTRFSTFCRLLYSGKSLYGPELPPNTYLSKRDTLDKLRASVAIAFREGEDDTAEEIYVKKMIQQAYLNGDGLLICELSAEGLTRWLNKSHWESFPEEIDKLEAMALFFRGVRILKSIYYTHGWLEEPKSFLQ